MKKLFAVLLFSVGCFAQINNMSLARTHVAGVNLQTGTSYTVLASDCGKFINFSNASSVAVTLPQATGSFNPCFFWVGNKGAGTVTVTPTTSTVDGQASFTLAQYQGTFLVSDGTNWYSDRGIGGGVTSIATTSPITGGPCTTTCTIAINNAAADGSTKGAASFTAADFNSSSGNISIDYTNGQAASGSNKGFLTSADWTTFNNKQAAIAGNSLAAHNFANSINSAGTISGIQPALSDLQSIAADAVVQNSSGSSAAPVATAVPNCANDGLHALIYSTVSHTWACQVISGGGGLCPTCLLGPDSSVIGGIVGTYPGAGFPSPNTSLPLNPFARGFSTNSGVVMPFSAGFRNMYVRASGMATGSSFVDFQREATGSSPTSTSRTGFAGVSIYPNAATGDYSSAWPLQVWPIQKGDVFDVVSFSIGSSTGILRGMSWEIIGSTSQLLGTDLIGGQVALSTTAYTGPSQSISVAVTTEALEGVIIPYAATAKSLCIRYVSAQSGTGSLVLTLRKNGTTSTALTTTIAASGSAGTVCDFTNTVSLAAGDWIAFQLQNNATASSTQIIGLTMELASPTAPATGMIIFGTGNQTIASGTARFASPFTTLIGTTEANQRAPLPRAVTMKNLSCIYTTPPGTNPVVVTIMQNGSASALTVSIPTTGAGTQTITDSTHTVAFVAGDEVSLQLNQSSGTNPAISSCSVEVD
jgi:hypothetical protein